MPLIVICGLPCSGKSVRAKQLKEVLSNATNLPIIVISDDEQFESYGKDTVYADVSKEKNLRASLKSEVHRTLSNDVIVIMDAQNYIKGYRYEVNCITKSAKTTQCIIWCNSPITDIKAWNELRDTSLRYSDSTLDALAMRFEPPDSQNRWENPLFTLLSSDRLPLTEILDFLMNRRAAPPNQSTQSQPLSPTNYLHELDKLTQGAIAAIISAQQNGMVGDKVVVPGCDETFLITRQISPPELGRLRRQFISHSKTRPIVDLTRIPTLFVQYLKSSVN